VCWVRTSFGPEAAEVINIFALTIHQGLTAESLRTTMFAYPTVASDLGYMLLSDTRRQFVSRDSK